MPLETAAALALAKLATASTTAKAASAATTTAHAAHVSAAAPMTALSATAHGHFTSEAAFQAWAKQMIDVFGVNMINHM